MSGFSTGLSAIRTAQQLIDLAANNIANANTPGYHARRAKVVADLGSIVDGAQRSGGVRIEDVTLLRDGLIEQTLLASLQTRERLAEEVGVLSHLEALFVEPSEYGLDARLGDFFESLSGLAANPADPLLRQQVVQCASVVCDALNRLDAELRVMGDRAEETVDFSLQHVNELSRKIADLNVQIKATETAGAVAAGLRDERDQLVTELAGLVNVSTFADDFGVVNISLAGTLLVDEGHVNELAVRRAGDQIQVVYADDTAAVVEVNNGQVAGVLNVMNDLVPRYREALDELANGLRRSVNRIHSTGLSPSGRFHELSGLHAFSTNDVAFAATGYGVAAGAAERLVINVEEEATGEITPVELTLDTTQGAADFLAALADAVNAGVDHVSASVQEGRLVLSAETGYAFGFATPYDPNPAQAGDITDPDPTAPEVMGRYTGAQDEAYTVTFLNGGRVGQDDLSLQIAVRDRDGTLLRTFTRTLPAGADPGQPLLLDNGLRLAFGAGGAAAGDAFSFLARADMDTAGVLDALGLNVLFTGLGAGALRVAPEVLDDPARLATGLGGAAGDNAKVLDLLDLRTERVLGDGTASLAEFYRALLGEVASAHATRAVQLDNQKQLVTTMENRRDAVSGVSVDEEMIRIIEARRIYQGAMRVLQVVNDMLDEMAAII